MEKKEKKLVTSHIIHCDVAGKEVLIAVYEDGTCECKWASREFRDSDGKWIGSPYRSWEDERRCRACSKNR